MKKLLLTLTLLTSFAAFAKIGDGMRGDTDTYGCGCGYNNYYDNNYVTYRSPANVSYDPGVLLY